MHRLINLVPAIMLLVSPCICGFPAGPASVCAVVAGLVVGALETAALVSFAQWEEWVNLIL